MDLHTFDGAGTGYCTRCNLPPHARIHQANRVVTRVVLNIIRPDDITEEQLRDGMYLRFAADTELALDDVTVLP